VFEASKLKRQIAINAHTAIRPYVHVGWLQLHISLIYARAFQVLTSSTDHWWPMEMKRIYTLKIWPKKRTMKVNHILTVIGIYSHPRTTVVIFLTYSSHMTWQHDQLSSVKQCSTTPLSPPSLTISVHQQHWTGTLGTRCSVLDGHVPLKGFNQRTASSSLAQCRVTLRREICKRAHSYY